MWIQGGIPTLNPPQFIENIDYKMNGIVAEWLRNNRDQVSKQN
jgi:hypothetical protein